VLDGRSYPILGRPIVNQDGHPNVVTAAVKMTGFGAFETFGLASLNDRNERENGLN
jgi:hypothetical protein